MRSPSSSGRSGRNVCVTLRISIGFWGLMSNDWGRIPGAAPFDPAPPTWGNWKSATLRLDLSLTLPLLESPLRCANKFSLSVSSVQLGARGSLEAVPKLDMLAFISFNRPTLSPRFSRSSGWRGKPPITCNECWDGSDKKNVLGSTGRYWSIEFAAECVGAPVWLL